MAIRVLLDTNVLVAALRSHQGASRILLVDALHGAFTTIASVPLMIEYEAVLTRPEHLKAAGLTNPEVQTLLDALATTIEPVRLAYLWRPVLADFADEMVLETAANGQADLLVTLNGRHFEPAAGRFAFKVVSPAETLDLLRMRKRS